LEFPLGDFTKAQTRELAAKFGLELANKPDSQDICFVPDGDYAKVVKSIKGDAVAIPGDIIDAKTGAVIGKHDGIINYTLGQRRRISVPSQVPLYVVKINPKKNEVIVGTEEFLFKTTCQIEEFNLTVKDESYIDFSNLTAKVRSSGEPLPCSLDIKNGIATMKEPTKMIAPGQAAVFYNGSKMVGGGFISKVIEN
jgi:tRNA-specific 2-thiouridylase